jgi:hypothetical protein
MKLLDFADILKKNKTVSQLQTTGGFAIKTLHDTTLPYIQVENVYERLGYLSVNNIVAVSECIKGSDTPDNVVFGMLKKFEKEVQMYGCKEDTGFVVGSNDPSISVTSVSSGCSVLNFNDIKIASIHLPGDGPNQTNQTISEFLDENLKIMKGENVDVVCGDTNITDAKSPKKGVDRKKELEDYFKQFFGGPCIVLTSNVKVGKHRRGFVLRNQQLKKSVPESTNDTEADGTIMAIKLNSSKQIDDTVLNELKRLNHSDSESQSVENALEFKVPSSECLNEHGSPIEKIWLDHSVLFINIRILCDLIGKECATNYPRNLIVVNMGSIVNAGFKSWNTKYLPFQSAINIADKDVYNIVRSKNPLVKFPEYEDIFGSSMLTSVDEGLKSTFGNGVDNIVIDEPSKEMMNEINERLSKLMLVLNRVQGGGNLKNRRKSRFTRRINKNKNKSINKRRIKLLKKISKRLRNKRRSSNFRL